MRTEKKKRSRGFKGCQPTLDSSPWHDIDIAPLPRMNHTRHVRASVRARHFRPRRTGTEKKKTATAYLLESCLDL